MTTEQLLLFEEGVQQGEYPVPIGDEPSKCRSCGAAIVWTRTAPAPAGKAIPLDLSRVRVVDGQRVALTHFATCPHGREWRR